MNFINKKNTLLNIIKYGPIFFVLIVSILTTDIFIEQKNDFYEDQIKKLEDDFLQRNEQRAKEEVNRVFNFIKKEKDESEALLKEQIKQKVYEAHMVATNIYKKESNADDKGHYHSTEHIFDTIKTALGGIIYNNGRGYIFMDDVNGVKLLQPLNKEFEGKNLYEYEDAKGYKFVKKIVETIKNKSEAYDSYYWFKAGNKEDAYKKISFYKYFEPFNIAIGTGEYVQDFENELKEKILKQVKNIRYNTDGYIFIYDFQGNSLSHHKEELIGINRIDVQNQNKKYVIRDILNFAKEKKEGFYAYNATTNPNEQIKAYDKISYIKVFEDWNWVIGTGFYLEALNKKLIETKEAIIKSNNEAIKDILFVSTIVTILFIFISFYISRIFSKIFEQYEKELQLQIEQTVEKEQLLVQQSKMAAMGEMIGNIAHQWKQPLSLISTSNGLLKLNKEYKDFSSEEEIEHAMEAIDNSVKNLTSTIDDFRNFFNPNKKKDKFKVEDSFDKTCKLISSQFNNNNIQVIKNIEDIEITAFENELLQTLINILKNAKEELVKLPKDKKRLIFLNTTTNNDKVYIEITDTAGGIPEDIINKVFENHFTTKESDGGSGIGLYMSKQIIEKNMKGKLSVSNEEFNYENSSYKGACFKIELPIEV